MLDEEKKRSMVETGIEMTRGNGKYVRYLRMASYTGKKYCFAVMQRCCC